MSSSTTPSPPPSRVAPQFVVRLPSEEFREQIAAAAKANNRSMNAEINARLQESFEGRLSFLPDNILRVIARSASKESRTLEGEVIDRLMLTMRPEPSGAEMRRMLEEDLARAEVKARLLEGDKRSARMQLVGYAAEMSALFELLRSDLTPEQQTEVETLQARTHGYLAWADTEMWDLESLKAKMAAAIAELEEHYKKVEEVSAHAKVHPKSK